MRFTWEFGGIFIHPTKTAMWLETRSDFAAQLRAEAMHRVGTLLRIGLTFTDAPPRPLKALSRATSNRLLKTSCCPPDLDAFAATEHRCLTTIRTSSDFILCDCLIFSTRTAGMRVARNPPHTRAIHGDPWSFNQH